MVIFTAHPNLANLNEVKMYLIVKEFGREILYHLIQKILTPHLIRLTENENAATIVM